MLSNTVSSSKTVGDWNFRPIPRRALEYTGCFVISRPRKKMPPSSACRCPVIRLKKVVFPAPFGPIKERSSLSSRKKSTRSTAINPPKYFARPRVSSIIDFYHQKMPVFYKTHDSLASEQHDQNKKQPDQQVPEVLKLGPQEILQIRNDQCPDETSKQSSPPPDADPHKSVRGKQQTENFRRNVTDGHVKHARDTRDTA